MRNNAADRLADAIRHKGNPTALGLDTSVEYLPKDFPNKGGESNEAKAKAIYEYNLELLDTLSDIIPCVKVQVAYYEMLGVPGMAAFRDTLLAARERGLVTVADAKRNDIGATAAAYAKAYLAPGAEFECDFITVNGYLGIDGIDPFLSMCKAYGKGIFMLVKTSNPSSGQLQDRELGGETVYEAMGGYAAEWGKDLIGECGYSSLGIVVGATYPEQASRLRKDLLNTFFLVPGYGAQGAGGKELKGCFDASGGGAVVNASRSLLTAHKNALDIPWKDAVRAEAMRMRDDLRG